MTEPEQGSVNPTVAFWTREISLSTAYYRPWHDLSKKIVKRYRDERSDALGSRRKKKLNIFWSNVETLKPAIFARTPKAQVERRFKDKDELAMNAGVILERATQFQIDEGRFDFHAREARDDYLIIGRGQMWYRYVPDFGAEKVDPQTQESYQPVSNERVECEYVQWEDFLSQRARRWDEVAWVARRVFLTRQQLVDKFGKLGEQVELDYCPKDVSDNDSITKGEQERFKKAVVWEIWDKATRKVIHIATGLKTQPLSEVDAPLKLKNFFPCPRPMFATMTTDTLIPIADFCLYQDQADQLDEINARRALLTKALKVRGVYPSSSESLKRLMSEAVEGDMIPVDNWMEIAAQGGLKNLVDFMPIRDIAEVLIRLGDEAEAVKGQIYEITGIADIVRGVSSPSETAAAQQIKGQFATLRISDRQMAFQEFLAEGIQIVAEIIAEQFSEQTLMAIVGLEVTKGDEQAFLQAVGLLRNDAMRSYRVTVETDSTIAIDEQADKASRSEFLNSVGKFMQGVLPLIQQMPEYGSVVVEMLDFGVRGFKAGRGLEGAIRAAGDNVRARIEQQQQQPQGQPPDPAMVELQQRMQLEQAKLQMEGQFKQAQFQQQAQMDGARVQLDAKKMEQEWAKEQQRAQLELQRTQATLALEAEKARADIMLKAEGMRQKNTLDTARQATAASAKGLKPDGKPHKPPVVRKVGKISRDVDGNKVVEMIEIPIEQEDEAKEGEAA